jgi:hypothetical protein
MRAVSRGMIVSLDHQRLLGSRRARPTARRRLSKWPTELPPGDVAALVNIPASPRASAAYGRRRNGARRAAVAPRSV